MGPAGEEVYAFEDGAVMFVEIAYDYQLLIGQPFGLGADQVVSAVARASLRKSAGLKAGFLAMMPCSWQWCLGARAT